MIAARHGHICHLRARPNRRSPRKATPFCGIGCRPRHSACAYPSSRPCPFPAFTSSLSTSQPVKWAATSSRFCPLDHGRCPGSHRRRQRQRHAGRAVGLAPRWRPADSRRYHEQPCKNSVRIELPLAWSQCRRIYDLPGFARRFDGTLTLANAGHLAPYMDGKELPLKIAFRSEFPQMPHTSESTLQFDPGRQHHACHRRRRRSPRQDRRPLRLRAHRKPQHSVRRNHCQTAQAFGQDDDITVLSIVRVYGAETCACLNPGTIPIRSGDLSPDQFSRDKTLPVPYTDRTMAIDIPLKIEPVPGTKPGTVILRLIGP